MKRLHLLCGLLCLPLIGQTLVTYGACTRSPISDPSCPSSSTFYGTLRQGGTYSFDDSFTAGEGDVTMVSSKSSFEFKEQCDYNEGTNPSFSWTSAINNLRGKISKGNTVKIIESSNYEIKALPSQRSYGNLLIKYNVAYKDHNNNDRSHTECKYYEISRCGDGILDAGYETCDPADTVNKKGWGDGCDASCKPTYNPKVYPVCESKYNGQRVSDLSAGTRLCSAGDYSNFNYSETAHMWTWKCNGSAGVTPVNCSATKPYCGDGIKDAGETCDPKDGTHAGWGDGCDSSCNPTYNQPVCESKYNGQRVTSLSAGTRLCSEGTYSNFNYSETAHMWTWKCNNKAGTKVDCSAIKPYCGDGIKDAGEACDPKDGNRVGWGDGCDASCNPTYNQPACESRYNGQRVSDLSAGTRLCSAGTYSNFNYSDTAHMWTWKCNNKAGANVDCSAIKPYCGDGIKDSGEACDPKDGNRVGWGDGCDASCNPTYNQPVCESKYNGQRLASLSAGTRLCSAGDYSNFNYSETSHRWTWKCSNKAGANVDCSATKPYCGDGIIDAGEACDPASSEWKNRTDGRSCSNSCTVIEPGAPACNSSYDGQRLSKLTKEDKLCNEGTYSDFNYSDSTHKWTWKCSNKAGVSTNCSATKPYCGDGIKDEGEKCDPADGSHAGWGDGCDASCNPTYNPAGTLKIEKTIVGSKEVKNTGDIITWNIKITAENGDVTNFTVIDKLPEVLSYDSFTLPHNPGLTVGDPTVNGSNVTWKVTGTLKKGEYLEIQLKTKAKFMPKKDYTNVACVKQEDKPEKCDDEPIIVKKGDLKIEKTLIGTKEIKNTGDNVVWSIKVTAEGGDVTDLVITDTMPSILGYKDSFILKNPGLTVPKPIVQGNIVTWNVEGTLKKGDYLEIQLTTYAKVMPDTDYKNVACVHPKDKPEEKKCDDEPVPAPKLRLKKSFTDGSKVKNNVKIGDEIGYKITFGNKGTASATITSIKDFLPKNVQYVSSDIYVNGQSIHTNNPSGSEIINSSKKVDGVYIDIYGGITLDPKAEGYIILTGKVLKDNQDNRTNFACIYLNDKKIECDDATHNIDGAVSCKPAFDPSSFADVCPNDTSTFSTTVTCSSTGGKADLQIICNGNVIKTGHDEKISGTCSSNSNNTDIKVQCKINGQTTGANGELCEGSFRRNTKNCDSPSCFPVGTKVAMADGTKKNIEDIEEGDMVLSYNTDTNTNESSMVAKTIVHEDNEHEMYELTINGKVLKATAVHPFYVRKSGFTNKYNRTFGVKNLIASIDYDWVEAQDLKVGDKLLMIDGSLVEIEKINHYPNKETVYNLEVEDNHDYFVDKGYLVHNKSCFLAGTKVIMADGTVKNIEDIKIGEKLLGSNGSINTVLSYDRHLLGERRVWSINGGEYFVSDEHPFMTTEGWKSFVPEKTKEELGWTIPELKVGDVLVTSNGLEVIERIDSKEMDRDTPIYNFALDGDNTYHANGYLVHNKGVTPTSCFVAGTQVIMADGTKKNIEDVELGEKVLGSNGSINTVLGFDRHILGDRHIWSINGGEYFVSDEHPFKTTEGWKSFVPEKTKEEIGWTIPELKVGDILVTSNGLEKIERVDSKTADYNTPIYNFILDGDHTYYANGYLVHNKNDGTTTPDPIVYPIAECFDINANQLSYEQGEILPFYWNISNLTGKNIWYGSGDFQNNKVKEGDKCEEDDEALIALNSLVCQYTITDAKENIIETDSFSCLTDDLSYPDLFDSWMKVGRSNAGCTGIRGCYWSFSTKDRDYALRSNLQYIPKFGSNATVFGEYKIKLSDISYLQCRDGKWKSESHHDVCESPFTLTNPYTVQKTPSGNLRASTETLSKYLYLDKSEGSDFSTLLNAISAYDYQPNKTVDDAMENFMSKYSKLAVNAGNGLKKVPGKNIYFISSDICLGSQCEKPVVKIDKPTTFVQTQGKTTTIKGDLDSNLMLLTDGTIKFEDKYSCRHRQVVKGIFYSSKPVNGIERTEVTKNTLNRLNNKNAERCYEGGLTVKGVLIGNGLQDMMEKSRSNLNYWFNTAKGGKNAKTVMNGASVIIEYSPSVFTKGSMPPGAEDFTTALSIYKN